MTDLWVIIVNYNSAELCRKAVESVAAERRSLALTIRCVIVDNASPDGSAKRLMTLREESSFVDWVDVLASEDNVGFGAGNNSGFRFAKMHPSFKKECFLLLLNPDATLEPLTLKTLLKSISQKPRAGAIGPRILNTDGSPHPSSFRFPTWLRQSVEALGSARIEALIPDAVSVVGETNKEECTDWLSGACILLRAIAVPEGGFDENFFLYFEEVDLCWQLHANGWEVWHCPDAHVVHARGQSTGWNSDRNPNLAWSPHWFKSRRYFLNKRYGVLYRVGCDLIVTAAHMTRRILEASRIARHRPHPQGFLFQLWGWRLSSKPREKA